MRKNFISRFLIFTLLGFALPPFAVAAELTEYRENIAHLKEDLHRLIAPAEDATDAENSAFEREVLEEFPELLPPRDKIEIRGTIIEINNQWVHDALDRYKKESPAAAAKRQAILIEISERLAALETKINQLEQATAAERTKDEDKQKLAEILQREEYRKPEEKPKSLIERAYDWVIEWLNKMFPPAEPRPNTAPVGNFGSFTFVLQMLLFALILSLIGFIIYRFAPFFAKKYRQRKTSEKKERVVLGERIAANETAESLLDEAERLAGEGNLRAAIRKGYIALLCELSERKIIGLSQHKTNRDYLRDVRQRENLYENMRGLTVNYERHWYGFDQAQPNDWETFRDDYRKAIGN